MRGSTNPKHKTSRASPTHLPNISCPHKAFGLCELWQSPVGKAGHCLVVSERPCEAAVGRPTDRMMGADPVVTATNLSVDFVTRLHRCLRSLCQKHRGGDPPQLGVV